MFLEIMSLCLDSNTKVSEYWEWFQTLRGTQTMGWIPILLISTLFVLSKQNLHFSTLCAEMPCAKSRLDSRAGKVSCWVQTLYFTIRLIGSEDDVTCQSQVIAKSEPEPTPSNFFYHTTPGGWTKDVNSIWNESREPTGLAWWLAVVRAEWEQGSRFPDSTGHL